MDEPPKYQEIVDRKDPPTFLESQFNKEINPQQNKEWAKDIEANVVSAEIKDAINRSRSASVISLISSQGIFLSRQRSDGQRRNRTLSMTVQDEDEDPLSYSRRASFPIL
eukprot:00030.XXX_288_617_1 [CDS] Oithona nana genome sequencing.